MKTIDAGLSVDDSPVERTPMNLARACEYFFHALTVIMMMGAFFPLVRGVFGYKLYLLQSDPIQNTVLSAIYVLVLIMLCMRMKEVSFMIAMTPAVWLLLLWAMLSVLWSGFPDMAFRRVLVVWLTSLYGLLLVLRFDLRQLLRLLGAILLMVMIGSLLLLVFFPEWAVMGQPLLGNWRGVFVHKTHLGRFSALAFLVAGVLIYDERENRREDHMGIAGGRQPDHPWRVHNHSARRRSWPLWSSALLLLNYFAAVKNTRACG